MSSSDPNQPQQHISGVMFQPSNLVLTKTFTLTLASEEFTQTCNGNIAISLQTLKAVNRVMTGILTQLIEEDALTPRPVYEFHPYLESRPELRSGNLHIKFCIERISSGMTDRMYHAVKTGQSPIPWTWGEQDADIDMFLRTVAAVGPVGIEQLREIVGHTVLRKQLWL
ncbi:hypothetical protein ACEPPN_005162 [Leptodophora sp. 'Broadleaf-Isolate-01']